MVVAEAQGVNLDFLHESVNDSFRLDLVERVDSQHSQVIGSLTGHSCLR